METLYFLMFIGICGATLVLIIVKSSNKPKKRTTKQNQNIWRNRRQHAHTHTSFPNKVVSKGTGTAYSLSAHKIMSDDELEADSELDEEVILREIEFHSVDTGYRKRSNTKG